jgi:hypothetical protein
VPSSSSPRRPRRVVVARPGRPVVRLVSDAGEIDEGAVAGAGPFFLFFWFLLIISHFVN